jgi:hypothetical protein
MKHDTTHELDIEMAHVQRTNRNLTDDGKSFDKQVVQGCALAELFLEFRGFGFELLIVQ